VPEQSNCLGFREGGESLKKIEVLGRHGINGESKLHSLKGNKAYLIQKKQGLGGGGGIVPHSAGEKFPSIDRLVLESQRELKT